MIKGLILGLLIPIIIFVALCFILCVFWIAAFGFSIIRYIFFEPSRNVNGDIDECIGCPGNNCENCNYNKLEK